MAMRARRLSLVHSFLGLALAPVLVTQASCKQRGVCDEVEGPCLALTVVGDEMPRPALEALKTTLQIDALTSREGVSQGEDGSGIELPTTLRLIPPPGVQASSVKSVVVTGVLGGSAVARGQTDGSFTWPDEVHTEATVRLSWDATPTDGGTETDASIPDDMAGPRDMAMPGDMAIPPPPTLKWTDESPAGVRKELHDVWATPGLTLAVGEDGVVLSRSMTGMWTQEASASSRLLWSTAINSAGTAWAVGEGPGSYRRDMTGWKSDATGLVMNGETLYSITPGASAGELWAGGDNGKVWRRNAATGNWTSESALPAGVRVTSVHYVDGVLFAVGRGGYATVRTDGWKTPIRYPDLQSEGLYGVWGFSKTSAVAVGSKGLLVRFSGDRWQTTTQRIEPMQNELNGVWGSVNGRIWAVGYNGVIVRVDGATVTSLRTDSSMNLFSVFGRSEADLFAVGFRPAMGGTSVILHGTP
jgi:hypothetical protein